MLILNYIFLLIHYIYPYLPPYPLDHESHLLSYVANQQFLTAQDIIRFTTNMITSTAPQHYSAAVTCCLSPTITGGTSSTSTRPNFNLTRPPTDMPSSSDKPQAITVNKVPLPSSSSSYTSSSADQEHLKVRMHTMYAIHTYPFIHTHTQLLIHPCPLFILPYCSANQLSLPMINIRRKLKKS